MISQKGLSRGGVFVALIMVLALVGCMEDGVDGLDGATGPAGPPGTATCLDCHNTATQNAIGYQYQRSQHAAGEYVDYAGGRSSCAMCHSGTGFTEWVATGDVDGNIENPVAIDCAHCHAVHTTFEDGDYALRTTAAVAWAFDEDYAATSVDFLDSSNLCANCHQSRRGEPELTQPGETVFAITSTHWGPHHGPQANVLAGVGFAEIAGSASYPATSLHLSQSATCITCHMAAYADEEGGHTWNPSLASCNGCHTVTDEDFDHGGVQTEIAALLDDLRDDLLALGVIEEDPEDPGHYIPLLDDQDVDDLDGDGNTTELFAIVTQTEARAFFNWVGLAEDRSLGAHNPGYVTALLENSIEALVP